MAGLFGEGIGGSLGGIASSLVSIFFWGAIVIALLTAMFFFARWWKTKKSYNIPCRIYIPRSDNTTQDVIDCVGGYFKSKPVGGTTTFRLKRKGVGIIELPPPPSRYLMGYNRHLHLVQKGMDDFEYVMPKSFGFVTVEGTNQRLAVVNLRCINQDATSWKEDNLENAKQRFTLHSFWEKYKDFIQMTIFIFIIFIAMYIMWQGLGEVATALKDVAQSLGPAVSNTPLVG